MRRFDGTAARQLDLIEETRQPASPRPVRAQAEARLRLFRRDLYAELERRRRRAQIAARHALDRS
jgi:hypothetical protein